MRASEDSLFIFKMKKTAKGKNLKRKAASVVKKVQNEWMDETIDPSDEEEVCILFTHPMATFCVWFLFRLRLAQTFSIYLFRISNAFFVCRKLP